MSVDAKQFDGTFGNAKALVVWGGGDGKICCGATEGFTDNMPGGLNLMTPISYVDTAGVAHSTYHYTDVPPGFWVVKSADGTLTEFSDAQFRVAFPQG